MRFDKDKTIQELLELSDEYSRKYPECQSCFDTLNGLMNAAKERDIKGIRKLELGLFSLREFDGWIPQIAERLYNLSEWADKKIHIRK